jgi:putative ABC transport system permease protein
MNFVELIKTALNSLGSNKPRTFLTMLGIIIGIASVISMLAIGNGSQKSIQSSVSSLGSNLLTITAGSQRTGLVQGGSGSNLNLTMSDVKAIRDKISGIDGVSPEYGQNAQIVAGKNNTNVTVTGIEPEYATVHNYQIGDGSFISTDQVTNESRVAVIGPDTATNLFGTDEPVGQTIKINKIAFKVVGVTVSKGSTGLGSQDDLVLVPLTSAQKVLFGSTKLRTIAVQGSSADTLDQVQTQISDLLLAQHKISDSTKADFTIRNSAQTLSTLSSVTGTFTLLLAAIGGISLVVGGIGIMNIMIVTVTERTREIGLRKAVGAKNATVLSQFLIEAVMLTFSGGLLGVALGYGISILATNFAGLATDVSPVSVLLSVGISVLVGVVFGLYPAYKASKLSPIEALRYE